MVLVLPMFSPTQLRQKQGSPSRVDAQIAYEWGETNKGEESVQTDSVVLGATRSNTKAAR